MPAPNTSTFPAAYSALLSGASLAEILRYAASERVSTVPPAPRRDSVLPTARPGQ